LEERLLVPAMICIDLVSCGGHITLPTNVLDDRMVTLFGCKAFGLKQLRSDMIVRHGKSFMLFSFHFFAKVLCMVCDLCVNSSFYV